MYRYTYVHIYIHICIYIHTYIHTNIHTYIHMYKHTYIQITIFWFFCLSCCCDQVLAQILVVALKLADTRPLPLIQRVRSELLYSCMCHWWLISDMMYTWHDSCGTWLMCDMTHMRHGSSCSCVQLKLLLCAYKLLLYAAPYIQKSVQSTMGWLRVVGSLKS